MKRFLLFFRQETGLSPTLWAVVALLNFGVQMIFCRDLQPGEFGTLNTALGVIGLLAVPALALNQAFAWYLARNHPPQRLGRIDLLRAAARPVTESFIWAWAGICVVLIFVLLPLLDLPRFSLNLFTLLNVLAALGGIMGGVICQGRGQWRLWACLMAGSALVRVLMAAVLAGSEPWAESGLAAFLFAGWVVLAPALHQPGASGMEQRLKALRTALDPDFLLYLGATFSVLLAVFLFTSADRIVAQSWFGVITHFNDGIVDWRKFDAYQAAGLLARALPWGAQPLLLLFFAQRSRLDRTTAASLKWFWAYLGALFSGAILLWIFRGPISRLFCGENSGQAAFFIPIFVLAMMPLGLLQGIGLFALASRRYQECFVIGGCGAAYALMLYLVGRQPELMPAYMFGGGLVALMIVLFVGVVRWGRKQP